jgi:ABC-type multidrug transport system ATPase subunit
MSGISDAERASRRALHAVLGFERYAGTRADQLSGGTLAKLNLGLALLADPEVLLLDEPYAGFDWDTYLRFRMLSSVLVSWFARLGRRRGWCGGRGRRRGQGRVGRRRARR